MKSFISIFHIVFLYLCIHNNTLIHFFKIIKPMNIKVHIKEMAICYILRKLTPLIDLFHKDQAVIFFKPIITLKTKKILNIIFFESGLFPWNKKCIPCKITKFTFLKLCIY